MLKISASTLAIALAAFGGSVSVYGMMAFAPGAEFVIAMMGGLFEIAKLTAYGLVGSRLPLALRASLLLVGIALAGLNVIGLNGFLSNHFERAQIEAQASNKIADVQAGAAVAAAQAEVSAADARIAKATEKMGNARGDRDQIKALNTLIADAKKDRNAAAEKLAAAQIKTATAAGQAIQANAEMASIIALAELTRLDVSTIAHRVFMSVAFLPEILEALFAIAAGMLGRKKEEAVEAPAKPAQAEIVEPAPVVTPAVELAPAAPVAALDEAAVLHAIRSARAKKGAATRKKNAAKAAKAAKQAAANNSVRAAAQKASNVTALRR